MAESGSSRHDPDAATQRHALFIRHRCAALLFCIYLLYAHRKPPSVMTLATTLPKPLHRRLNFPRKAPGAGTHAAHSTPGGQLARLQRERTSAIQEQLSLHIADRDQDASSSRRANRCSRLRHGRNIRKWIETQNKCCRQGTLRFHPVSPVAARKGADAPPKAEEEFERWFQGVAHGYDIPVQQRGVRAMVRTRPLPQQFIPLPPGSGREPRRGIRAGLEVPFANHIPSTLSPGREGS